MKMQVQLLHERVSELNSEHSFPSLRKVSLTKKKNTIFEAISETYLLCLYDHVIERSDNVSSNEQVSILVHSR